MTTPVVDNFNYADVLPDVPPGSYVVADQYNVATPDPAVPPAGITRRARIYDVNTSTWKFHAVKTWNGAAWVERQVHGPAA